MKTTRFFLSLIVLSILWCADVFAHEFGEGNPIRHFAPLTPDDPCYERGNRGERCGAFGHPEQEEFRGGHGHVVANGSGYWKAKHSPGRTPTTSPTTTSTTTSTTTPTTSTTSTTTLPTTPTITITQPPPLVATKLVKISGDGQQGAAGQSLANPFVVAVQDQTGRPLVGTTVTFAVTAGGGTLSATTPTTDTNGQAQTTLTLGSTLGTNTVQASVEGIEQPQVFSAEASLTESVRQTIVDSTGADPRTVRLYQFELQLQQGWNLIHLPLTVYAVNNELHRIQTAANLYQLIQPTFMFIHSSEDGFMGTHEETDIILGPNQGIAVLTDKPATFTLVGTRLPEPFRFERGLNLVGMPRQSVALQRVSDFLAIYEEAFVVVTTVDGEFSLVGRAADPGDHETSGGQSFFIVMTAPRETFFYGPAWGTPIQ